MQRAVALHSLDGCFFVVLYLLFSFFFFFNDTATTEIYTLSLHDALPISTGVSRVSSRTSARSICKRCSTTSRCRTGPLPDRKSTRLNSSHGYISYAVFCLKKKKKRTQNRIDTRDPTTCGGCAHDVACTSW